MCSSKKPEIPSYEKRKNKEDWTNEEEFGKVFAAD